MSHDYNHPVRSLEIIIDLMRHTYLGDLELSSLFWNQMQTYYPDRDCYPFFTGCISNEVNTSFSYAFVSFCWVYRWVSARRRNSIANALELRLSCPNPSICYQSLWIRVINFDMSIFDEMFFNGCTWTYQHDDFRCRQQQQFPFRCMHIGYGCHWETRKHTELHVIIQL